MGGNVTIDNHGDFQPEDPYLPMGYDIDSEDEQEVLSECCWVEITNMGFCERCLEHCN